MKRIVLILLSLWLLATTTGCNWFQTAKVLNALYGSGVDYLPPTSGWTVYDVPFWIPGWL